jgi:hypothetical protein
MANALHFAVCIGIDRYPGFPGRDLGSARRDATAFRDWLTDPQGGDVPPENVKLVTVEEDEFGSVGDARPQQREINRALADFHQRLREHLAVNPEDWTKTRMYIYAAGHGIGPPMGEGAVLMADADEEMLGNSIELSLYANWYLHCGLVHEVAIFADCCREIIRGIPPVSAPPFNICQNPSFVGTVRFIGYASRLGEVAWEPADPAERDTARGYFTAALIDGLRGAAADRETGEVTAASLAQYVQGAVEAATAGIGPYPQRGELRGDLGTKLVFRSGAGVQAPERTVRITLPAGLATGLAVRAGTGASDVRARRAAGEAGGTWELHLPDGFYQVVAEGPDPPAFAGQGLFAVTGSDVDVRL